METDEYQETGFIRPERAMRFFKHLSFSFIKYKDQKQKDFRKKFVTKLNELSDSKTSEEEAESEIAMTIEDQINDTAEIQAQVVAELEDHDRVMDEIAKDEKVDSKNIKDLKKKQKENLDILKKLDSKMDSLKSLIKDVRPTKEIIAHKKRRVKEVEKKMNLPTKSPKQLQIEKQIADMEEKYEKLKTTGKFSKAALKKVLDRIELLKLRSI